MPTLYIQNCILMFTAWPDVGYFHSECLININNPKQPVKSYLIHSFLRSPNYQHAENPVDHNLLLACCRLIGISDFFSEVKCPPSDHCTRVFSCEDLIILIFARGIKLCI